MKNIQKSIRMSEEVFETVDNFEGNGFNDKFENFVKYYKFKSRKIIKLIGEADTELRSLEKQIEEKRTLLKQLEEAEQIISSAKRYYLNKLHQDCNSKDN